MRRLRRREREARRGMGGLRIAMAIFDEGFLRTGRIKYRDIDGPRLQRTAEWMSYSRRKEHEGRRLFVTL